MGWLEKLCRETGLMIHYIVKPPKDSGSKEKTTVSRKVEEKKLNETTTLRRTTIDEIEVRKSSENE